MYVQIKSKVGTTSIINVVSIKESDLNIVDLKVKDNDSLILALNSLKNMGLNVSKKLFKKIRIKGYKQLLIK